MGESSLINGLEIVTTLFVKSLPTSLFQREEFPSLEKRGEGRFYRSMPIQF
jgi:hypothetical protein